MKRFFAIISAGAAFAVFAAEATYRNPVIWADVPDTALCSDGTNVYMFYGTGELVELTSDLTGEKPDGFRRQIPVRDDEECGLLEGSVAFKVELWNLSFTL